MNNLLLLERIILESLGKKEKNILELSIDTNLDQLLLLNLLPQLLMKNLINYQRGIYRLSSESCNEWKNSINSNSNIKAEVKELFSTLINNYFASDIKKNVNENELKVKKVWLTKDEEKVLQNHLLGLENFFKSVQEKRLRNPEKSKTCEQKVIFWGIGEYGKLVERVLDAV